MGSVEQILPEGVNHVRDLPFPVFDAVRRAMLFISFDELPSDERPPRAIWLNQEALNEHFDQVRLAREEKYGDGSSGSSREIDDPVQNELAKEMKRARG